jgi:transposase
MPKKLQLRSLTTEERNVLQGVARSRTEAVRRVERAQELIAYADGVRVVAIAQRLQCSEPTIYSLLHRFDEQGLAALDDAPRPGRPPIYREAARGELLVTAQTHPHQLGMSFGHWTLDRLVVCAHEQLHIEISRSQLGELLHAAGLKWYQEKSCFSERPDPQFVEKGRDSPALPTAAARSPYAVSTKWDP